MGDAWWPRRSLGVVVAAVVVALLWPAVAVAQTVDESFASSPVALNTTTTLTFTIANPDAPTPHTVSFDDTLPAGLEVSSGPTTTCTGGAPSSSGPSDVAFTGAVVDSSCTVSAQVEGVEAGSWNNPVTVNIDGAPSQADASVNVDAPPTIAKSFSPSGIRPGATTTLTFTIGNPSDNPDDATGIAFGDTLPTGLTVESGATTTACGGTLTTTSSTGMSFSGGTLTPGQTCQIPITVTGSTEGTYTNTTGPIASNEGGSGATASAGLTVAAPPAVADSISSPLPLGATTTVRLTLTNPNGQVTLTDAGFNESLPPEIVVAPTPNASTTCSGGTPNATPGNSTVTLSGITLGQGASCTAAVDVRALAAGAGSTQATPTSEVGAGNPTSSPIHVDAPPALAAAFSPNDIRPGATTALTFTLTNPAGNPDGASNVQFIDALPNGLTVASGAVQTCGGTLTTTAPSSISVSGASLAPGSQCEIPVTVTGAADGNYTNPTGAIASNEGGSGAPASAALTVAAPPALAQSFGAGAIGQGAVTSLTFTLANPNASVPLTGIGFTASLPPALPVASPNGLADTCGGTASAPAGGSSVSLSGGQLAPGASCTVSIQVMGSAPGRFTSTSGAPGSTEGGSGIPSQAFLTVIGPPQVSVASPAAGASYAFGQKVRASYSCADDPNGPGISSCHGTVANGALIDTSKAGLHIFTITATSLDGGNSSDLVFYTVGPNSRFKLLNVRVRPDGSLDFRIKVPGRGQVDVVERTRARPAILFARGRARANRAKTLHLVLRPNARGRQAVKRRRGLRVSVLVAFTPTGGKPRTVRFTFKVPS